MSKKFDVCEVCGCKRFLNQIGLCKHCVKVRGKK